MVGSKPVENTVDIHSHIYANIFLHFIICMTRTDVCLILILNSNHKILIGSTRSGDLHNILILHYLLFFL